MLSLSQHFLAIILIDKAATAFQLRKTNDSVQTVVQSEPEGLIHTSLPIATNDHNECNEC